MPVSFVPPPEPEYPTRKPDIGPPLPQEPLHVVDATQEVPPTLPENFDQLTPQEQEEIKAKIRFYGIKKGLDEPFKVTRETLDLP